jgi:hypothetical protein
VSDWVCEPGAEYDSIMRARWIVPAAAVAAALSVAGLGVGLMVAADSGAAPPTTADPPKPYPAGQGVTIWPSGQTPTVPLQSERQARTITTPG